MATGVAVSTAVDMTRLSVYFNRLSNINTQSNLMTLLFALSGALLGTWIGNSLLKKITMHNVQLITTYFLIFISILLGIGWL